MKISDILDSDGRCYTFVDFLKACILYKDLLTEFEREFAEEFIDKYKKFKFNLVLSRKQMTTINELADKLGCAFYFTSDDFNKVV